MENFARWEEYDMIEKEERKKKDQEFLLLQMKWALRAPSDGRERKPNGSQFQSLASAKRNDS